MIGELELPITQLFNLKLSISKPSIRKNFACCLDSSSSNSSAMSKAGLIKVEAKIDSCLWLGSDAFTPFAKLRKVMQTDSVSQTNLSNFTVQIYSSFVYKWYTNFIDTKCGFPFFIRVRGEFLYIRGLALKLKVC